MVGYFAGIGFAERGLVALRIGRAFEFHIIHISAIATFIVVGEMVPRQFLVGFLDAVLTFKIIDKCFQCLVCVAVEAAKFGEAEHITPVVKRRILRPRRAFLQKPDSLIILPGAHGDGGFRIRCKWV